MIIGHLDPGGLRITRLQVADLQGRLGEGGPRVTSYKKFTGLLEEVKLSHHNGY